MSPSSPNRSPLHFHVFRRGSCVTAEWEQKLTDIAKGGDADAFLNGIRAMVKDIVSTYSHISEEGQKLFAPEKETVGNCPRCGKPVYEGKKNFACSDRCSTMCYAPLYCGSYCSVEKRPLLDFPQKGADQKDGGRSAHKRQNHRQRAVV